jgi:hypothetical protein
MRRETQYRLFIWLPLAVPAVIALLVNGLGVAPTNTVMSKFVQVQLMALGYGGLVYAPLAVWATWWVGGRGEAQVRRLMFRAPLLMAALYAVAALLVGVLVGQVRVFAGVALLGVVASVVLGYCYVALVVLLRRGGGGAA